MYKIRSPRRPSMLARLCSFLIGLTLLGTGAMAGEAEDFGKLETIYQIALTDNARALTEARTFAAGMTPDSSYAVRVELLKTRLPILLEAGQPLAARDDI